MIIKIVDLIKNKKIKIENITNQQIRNNKNLIVQTGIGDLLLVISLLKAQVLKGPLYININIYVNNIYQFNNILDTLKFKLQLIEKTDTINDIVFFYDDNIEYTPWEQNLKLLNTFILQKYFTFNKTIEQEYIIFHTKCRFYENFDYNKLKQNLKIFFEQYKSNYKIVIIGERYVPDNLESIGLQITTIYDEILLLKNNNDVLDLSIENIYDNLNFENFLQDISLIHHAKTNILVGVGGSFCSCLVFANNLITYIDDVLFYDHLLLSFHYKNLQTDNKYICNSFENYLNYIKDPENPEVLNCYFLGHLGLGDNITNSSAVNYLLQHYNTIYFFCKDIYEKNVKLLFQTKRVIIIPVNSDEAAINIINSNINTDRFISGCYCQFLKTKTFLKLNETKIDEIDEIDFDHINNFYKDNQLDLSIYYNYFNIPPSDVDITLLLNYKIIFLHTHGSNRQIDLTKFINTYKFNKEYILINPNKNVYNPSEEHYLLANKYVNLLVCNYIDIIKNAILIHVIDSCFSCIVYPLMKMDKLKAEVTIYTIKSEISNFEWEQYIANYPDLKKAGINNKIKALNHYNNFGKKEYRSFKKI